jgi:hypothetical protein
MLDAGVKVEEVESDRWISKQRSGWIFIAQSRVEIIAHAAILANDLGPVVPNPLASKQRLRISTVSPFNFPNRRRMRA